MPDDLSLAELDGAFVALRAAVAAETRTFRVDFADAVYGESRTVNSGKELLEYIANQPGRSFQFAVLGEGVDTLPAADLRFRVRRYRLLVPVAQWYTDGDGEDLYFDRIEIFENRWNAKMTFAVSVDGIVIDFLVLGSEEAEPLFVDRAPDPARVGHTSMRRLAFEVEACAQ